MIPEKMNTFPRGPFNTLPAFKISNGRIKQSYQELAALIKTSVPKGLRVLVIDGYQGVNWEIFKEKLDGYLKALKINPSWKNIDNCYAPSNEIKKRIDPFLGGDDPIFGRHYPFGLEVFFDVNKIAEYRIKSSVARGDKAGKLIIVYGCGSSLIELWDQLWYIDIPKDLIQELFRKGGAKNIGEEKQSSFADFYKRSYFVEWPALNRLKKQLLPDIDMLIDLQNIYEPSFINGNDFRLSLSELSLSPFRLRPWFYPGPWGGKFMQGHMGLDPNQPNFAWSFEMIVPENGIIIEKGKKKLEFSFDFLMFQENKNILGVNAAKQFKYEWPIRLDYLDTIDGGNLSTQVHPRPNYIREKFGETYTQDETYYIVASKPDAKVYLGLTEDCDPSEFKNAIERID